MSTEKLLAMLIIFSFFLLFIGYNGQRIYFLQKRSHLRFECIRLATESLQNIVQRHDLQSQEMKYLAQQTEMQLRRIEPSIRLTDYPVNHSTDLDAKKEPLKLTFSFKSQFVCGAQMKKNYPSTSVIGILYKKL